MAEIVADSACHVTPVTASWELALSPAGAWDNPAAAGPDWIPAIVPGTAAAALEAAGRWRRDRPGPLHDQDVWFRAPLTGPGPRRLRFGGLATLADVWLDGEPILRSDNMFLAHEVEVALRPQSWLHIAFRSLSAALAVQKGPRARWRTRMIPDQRLRLIRTTLLGHMPGWCPPVDLVGPWRPVELVETASDEVFEEVDLRATLEGDVGRLVVTLASATPLRSWRSARLSCAGRTVLMRLDGGRRLTADLALPGVAPWWPHTHGDPALHEATVLIGERRIDLGRVGFRRIALDKGGDGHDLRLRVNDVPVFCRGAVWTPPDLVAPPCSRTSYAPSLDLAREAGLNMLRVSGTTLYESRAFHDLCDEYGILVWQDFMFANFDYPAADDVFADSVRREAAQVLHRLQGSPSLAVLCGGSEVAQQAAMLGLPPASWSNRITDAILPDAIAVACPGTPAVPSSPFGGDLPFAADAGCTHYYGVGAYRRPLDDARRAEVRFASECLAFANIPEPAALRKNLSVPAVHHPAWKEGVPRDLGASWDFEDVRDHYCALLYGVDPLRLRSEDPERYLFLSRVTVADVMEATFAEWRRPGSPTGGALVWLWQDLRPGAGWGILDHLGRPKSAWYALRRAFRPIQIVISDEGVNGLRLHALNDRAEPVAGTISFTCLRHGRMPVASGQVPIVLPARGHVSASATEILGGFFDANYAYRFGRPEHDVCQATLSRGDGAMLAAATYWLPDRRSERHHLGLTARTALDNNGWSLTLSTERMAAAIAIDDEIFCPEDNYFDLAPGIDRVVRLSPRDAGSLEAPNGTIAALNAVEVLHYADDRKKRQT